MTSPDPTPPHRRVVVMGVAGCGKSAVAEQIAHQTGLPLVEGDDFHPEANIQKMRQGLALTDEDRASWLARLAGELAARPGGAVLTCSALKRAYRDALRAGASGDLVFVQLAITPAEASRRVASRPGHFYPPSLVASQFDALEDPSGEPGVHVLDGTQPVAVLAQMATQWLRSGSRAYTSRL